MVTKTILIISKLLSIALIIFFFSFARIPRQAKFRVFVTTSKAKDHIKMMAAAEPALKKMAEENQFEIDISADTALITEQNLAGYQVFIPLQQAPFDMSPAQQLAVQHFVEKGGGWVGIHAGGLTGNFFKGADKPYWQWFEDFMGGIIYSPHPGFQKGILVIEDSIHPVTKGLPAQCTIADEWYEFNKSPRSNVRVLAVADESSYKQNKPMGDHPIIWVNEHFRRMVYIGIGHDPYLWQDNNFSSLVRNAILWAGESK
jgi:chitinase